MLIYTFTYDVTIEIRGEMLHRDAGEGINCYNINKQTRNCHIVTSLLPQKYDEKWLRNKLVQYKQTNM